MSRGAGAQKASNITKHAHCTRYKHSSAHTLGIPAIPRFKKLPRAAGPSVERLGPQQLPKLQAGPNPPLFRLKPPLLGIGVPGEDQAGLCGCCCGRGVRKEGCCRSRGARPCGHRPQTCQRWARGKCAEGTGSLLRQHLPGLLRRGDYHLVLGRSEVTVTGRRGQKACAARICYVLRWSAPQCEVLAFLAFPKTMWKHFCPRWTRVLTLRISNSSVWPIVQKWAD